MLKLYHLLFCFYKIYSFQIYLQCIFLIVFIQLVYEQTVATQKHQNAFGLPFTRLIFLLTGNMPICFIKYYEIHKTNAVENNFMLSISLLATHVFSLSFEQCL